MSENKEDFVSFEKALQDLKLQSEELKKLVSEGDIRAYRDGSSMKFKREDVEALAAKKSGEGELVFADTLEDDTGMVTEELSDEDTLLAEEPVEAKAAIPAKGAGGAIQKSSRRALIEGPSDSQAEPKWVAVVGILCSAVMIYGFMVLYNISTEELPAGLTSMFAPK